jgi:amino acid transporter
MSGEVSGMKKVKRILALVGVILLVALYLATIVCALWGSDNYMDLLMASVFATVVIPVLLWAYGFLYRLLRKDDDPKDK